MSAGFADPNQTLECVGREQRIRVAHLAEEKASLAAMLPSQGGCQLVPKCRPVVGSPLADHAARSPHLTTAEPGILDSATDQRSRLGSKPHVVKDHRRNPDWCQRDHEQ